MSEMIYSNRRGKMISADRLSKAERLQEQYIRGACPNQNDPFPYDFDRKYEAVQSFNIFAGKQFLTEENKKLEFKHADLLKYTFGLEFETCCGFIPEDLVLRDGIIPLRDGSVNSLEFSTVVLGGAEGLKLLKQATDTLKKYTTFDKECSLHIHLGGFPLRSKKVFNLYRLCYQLQRQISMYVPKFTFNGEQYKASHKNYCQLLQGYGDFDEMYYSLVGQQFSGSFRLPHPNDPGREQKWRIHSRYFWVNFVNFLCYNVNKTIEFRLLRPTYNFRKICVWLYIFNAIMIYAEKMDSSEDLSNVDFEHILRKVYPAEFADTMSLELTKLYIVAQNLNISKDYIGQNLYFEEELFDSEELL